LEGDWDTFEGQFFDMFDEKIHVLGPDFEFPQKAIHKDELYYMTYTRVGGYDYGSSEGHAACYLQAYVDNLKNIYFWEEFYQFKMGPREQSRYILPLYRGDPEDMDPITKYAIADPSIFAKTQEIRGEMRSIGDIFEQCGIEFYKGSRDRLNRAAIFKDGLENAINNQPGAIYINYKCKNLIRTLPILTHDKKNPEDVNTDEEDHAYDAGGYLASSIFSSEHTIEPQRLETTRQRNVRLKSNPNYYQQKEEESCEYQID